ncbi:MAG: Ger(x)C family spore germination protein [Bacillota bacterium]|nr:Ger(x)C family spore germination protein [Bacillota bacterium]
MNRIIGFILIIFILCTMLSGCYDSRDVDDLTYVIAVGLDKGKLEPLRLTLQYAVPKEMGGGGGGGGGEGGGSKAISTVTVECSSLSSGINLVNGFVSKQINVSHAIVAVFSEELAKEGISKFLYGMERGREFRPNMYVAVSRGSAEHYLSQVQPIQEVDPTKYYQLIFSSYKYTGFAPNSKLFSLLNKFKNTMGQPVVALAGVSKHKSLDDFAKDPDFAKKPPTTEQNFLPGNIIKQGDIAGEIMGLAVFDGDKFMGEMTGEESTDYLMVTGDYSNSYLTMPDPKKPDNYIILNVKQSRYPVSKVKLMGNTPQINVEIKLEADFIAIQSGFNYENPQNLGLVENAASSLIKDRVTRFLNRTSKEFQCDICSFGKEAVKKFLTTKQWNDYNWFGKYKNANFNVKVEMRIRRPGLMIRTVPINTSQGG